MRADGRGWNRRKAYSSDQREGQKGYGTQYWKGTEERGRGKGMEQDEVKGRMGRERHQAQQ